MAHLLWWTVFAWLDPRLMPQSSSQLSLEGGPTRLDCFPGLNRSICADEQAVLML